MQSIKYGRPLIRKIGLSAIFSLGEETVTINSPFLENLCLYTARPNLKLRKLMKLDSPADIIEAIADGSSLDLFNSIARGASGSEESKTLKDLQGNSTIRELVSYCGSDSLRETKENFLLLPWVLLFIMLKWK